MIYKIRKICLVVSSEMTVKAFLKKQIAALSEHYDVTLIVNTKCTNFAEQNDLDIKVIPLVIERSINPIADIRALYRLISIFRRRRFDLVHSVTPKAGLLAMVAGLLARIQFRIHTFTGQVWATRSGFSRFLLKIMDGLLASSATHLLTDSASQRQFLIDQGVTSAEKLNVLADGSISGVDVKRFRFNKARRYDIRGELGIADNDILVLFLGRLNADKGVLDLAAAFTDIAERCKQVQLLFVGPDEACLKEDIKQMTDMYSKRVHFVDYTDKPELYFSAADIFCLPSYREGFGSVIIEAAACGIPAVASNIYGISDAVIDGETGVLFDSGNVLQLGDAIEKLLLDSDLRKRMGEVAMLRAHKDFPVKRLLDAWLGYYDGLQ